MPKLYRILGSIAVLFILASTVIFSFTLIFLAAAGASLYGIYHHYTSKKRAKKFTGQSVHISGEIIDLRRDSGRAGETHWSNERTRLVK